MQNDSTDSAYLPPTNHMSVAALVGAPTISREPANSVMEPNCLDVQFPDSEGIGSTIGNRYRIVSLLGQGGMGAVFLAEQTNPIRRLLALKVIKPTIDGKRILVRFDAERQALALMDHANISKMFDAGTTESGRPYFVMEYVPGVPITRFCDVHKLNIPRRLELFIQLCAAVQHAHQKGIIHRDLKPSNILVEWVDGQPVLKVIDFGLAKALHKPLVEHAERTIDGALLGTPLYMAPEQIRSDGVDADTRADIYALGVIFYELLAGATPLTREQVQRASLDELLKLLREKEVAKPSESLKNSPALEAISHNRGAAPDKLVRLVSGDLDWIAMKALEKDRNRRYDTASSFAADILCHLRDEPVSAGPPSRRYRLYKFIRRNRGGVAAAALILLVLIGGAVGTTIGMVRANLAAERFEREKLEAERQTSVAEGLNDFLQYDLLGQADIRNQTGFSNQIGREPNIKVRTLLDRAAKRIDGRFQAQPLTEAAIRRTIGATYRALGELPAAQLHLEKALALFIQHRGETHTDTITAKNLLATLYQDLGMYSDAERLHRDVLEATLARVGENHIDTFTAKINLALLYQNQGQTAQAESLYAEVLPLCESQLGVDHPKTLTVQHNLATLYQSQGKYHEAERIAKAVLAERTTKLGEDHPNTLAAKQSLANLYKNKGNHDEAEKLYKEVWLVSTDKLGKDHLDTLTVQHNLATLYQAQNRLGEAETEYKEVLALRESKLGADHVDTLTTKHNLATLHQAQGRYSTAETLYRDVLTACLNKLGAEHTETLTARNNLALLCKIRGHYAEAEVEYKDVLTICENKLGKDHPNTLAARHNLASLYQTQGKYLDAERLHKEVLALSEGRLGADHPDTLTAKYNLALLYSDENQWEQAERLCRDLLEKAQKKNNKPSLSIAGFQGQLGMAQLSLHKFDAAESVLKPCLQVREKLQPYAWTTFNTKVLLGWSYAGQTRFEEAEPLLLAGYNGLKQQEDRLPPQGKTRLLLACIHLRDFYTRWGKREEATVWQARIPPELAPFPRELP
jgi:serine/threonine protein kinase